MYKKTEKWARTAVVGAALLSGAMFALSQTASAGSVSSTDTYAADANGLALPTGTVIVFDYVGYRHADAFVDTTGKREGANADIYTNIARIDWFAANIGGHPLVLHAALPWARLDEVNIPSLGGRVQGESGFFSPVLFQTLGLIVAPKEQRYLGISNYEYLPAQRYDERRLNVGTPGQFVDVAQIVYAEGLAKFSPALNNFWLDVIANASFHGDGKNPVTADTEVPLAPGVAVPGTASYRGLKQDDSYDIKAYARYNWNPALWVAVGIEKSWGGEQIATQGRVNFAIPGVGATSAALPDRSLGKDDYLKGHIQFEVPFSADFHATADLTHDFERTGGLREDFTAEVRFTKLFIPQAQSQPLK